MTAVDPRVARTREAFREALLTLHAEAAEVTVTSLCLEAGVNRSTFYLHYRDIDELAVDTIRTELVRASGAWARELAKFAEGDAGPDSTVAIGAFLAHMAANRGLYRWALGPQGRHGVVTMMFNEFAAIIRAALRLGRPVNLDPDGRREASFLAGAILGSLTHWLFEPEPADPASMAAWIWREVSARVPVRHPEPN